MSTKPTTTRSISLVTARARRHAAEIWDSLDHWEADNFGPNTDTAPSDDLTADGDHACLAVIEVTEDCNLSCSYCFASSEPGDKQRSPRRGRDPLETVYENRGAHPI